MILMMMMIIINETSVNIITNNIRIIIKITVMYIFAIIMVAVIDVIILKQK